jgi:hypothetical protein
VIRILESKYLSKKARDEALVIVKLESAEIYEWKKSYVKAIWLLADAIRFFGTSTSEAHIENFKKLMNYLKDCENRAEALPYLVPVYPMYISKPFIAPIFC